MSSNRYSSLIVIGLVGCALTPADRSLAESEVATRAAETALSNVADCRARPDPAQVQYIVGYGSLMQDESRKRTSPQAGPAHPVDVSGFRRGWFAKVDPPGFSTTYLGVVPDGQAHLNAVIYQVDAAELAATDQREASYCRVAVPVGAIKALEKDPFAPAGQIWIYANKPESIGVPSARLPIVQSYVDIFVGGCFEQEQRFALAGFAQQCIATTQHWSAHWVNDRLHARRPFIHQPRARQIDALLSQQLPELFAQIGIE
jgi:hypothetical protein